MRYWLISLVTVFAFLIGAQLGPSVWHVASAQRERRTQLSVPRAWGKVIGIDSGAIVFEAGDGTIRFYVVNYSVEKEQQVALTIARN